jgi:hypothetical protein
MDQPWEIAGSGSSVVGVIPDPTEDRLRMYYMVRFSGEGTRNILCVAFSRDGLTWEKPDLGDGNNIVMRSAGNPMNWGTFHCQSISYDPNESNPAWRWKLLFWGRRDPDLPPGFHFAGSADGLAWSPVLERPVITNANDAGSFGLPNPRAAEGARDSSILLYQQTWRYDPDLPVDRDNLDFMQRVISIWTVNDFPTQWVGPTQVIVPDDADAPDLQFYWFVPFYSETGYYGLMNIHHTGDQTMDVQLMSSADGWTWQRELDREPLVPPGERGRFDCGMVHIAARPVIWKGKVLLYYNGRATVHDHQQRHPTQSPARTRSRDRFGRTRSRSVGFTEALDSIRPAD